MTSGARPVRAPRGATLTAKGWPQEAALRMLQNNLDPEVAERPDAGRGAARSDGGRRPGAPPRRHRSPEHRRSRGPRRLGCADLRPSGVSAGLLARASGVEGRGACV